MSWSTAPPQPEATPYNSPALTATRKRFPTPAAGGNGDSSFGSGAGFGSGSAGCFNGGGMGAQGTSDLSRVMWGAQLDAASSGGGEHGLVSPAQHHQQQADHTLVAHSHHSHHHMHSHQHHQHQHHQQQQTLTSLRRELCDNQLEDLRTSVAVQLPHLEDASRGRPNGAASAEDPTGMDAAFAAQSSDVLAALNSLEVQPPGSVGAGAVKYYPTPEGGGDGSGQWVGGYHHAGGGAGGGYEEYEDGPHMVAPVSGHGDEFVEDLHALTRKMEAANGLKSPILSSSPTGRCLASPTGPVQFHSSTDYQPPSDSVNDAELSMLMDRMMDSSGVTAANPSGFMPYIS